MPHFSTRQIFAVFIKDIKSEFRTRYAISAVILFILTTITMILFGTYGEKLSVGISVGMLWIVMFFGAMTGLSRSFVTEEERGTSFLLQLSIKSGLIYVGKLCFNIILCILLNFITVLLYLLFVNNNPIHHPLLFVITILLSSIGIAGATTIISAIISKANTKNALFPVLSFPVLLPLIMVGIETTIDCFDISKYSDIISNFGIIFAYCGILITASYMLFDIVWNE